VAPARDWSVSELGVAERGSVPLVGYPQRYGKRGSTLASTSVVLHGDEKSAGMLPKGTFSPGWPVGAASSAVGFADKEASLSPPAFTQFFVGSLPAHTLRPTPLVCGRW